MSKHPLIEVPIIKHEKGFSELNKKLLDTFKLLQQCYEVRGTNASKNRFKAAAYKNAINLLKPVIGGNENKHVDIQVV